MDKVAKTLHHKVGATITVLLPSVVAFGIQIALPENRFVLAFAAISLMAGSMLFSWRWVAAVAGANTAGVLLLLAFVPAWSFAAIAARLSFVAAVTALSIFVTTYRNLVEHDHKARLGAAERRAAELTQALEKQRELEHLRTEFIQDVSHELRTPLGIVHGYAELLESGALGELQSQQQEPVAIIVRRTRMLSKLMDDIATILAAQTQELKREPVNLSRLVQNVLADFRVAAEEQGLTLTIEIAPDLPWMFGDPLHLQRVVDNLLGNALKFTPAGGGVTARLRQEGRDMVLEVADTGIGVPSDQLEHIFERFYRINGGETRTSRGSGLGLALVKEIVEAHGGQIAVHSTPGEGSVFQVVLPTAEA